MCMCTCLKIIFDMIISLTCFLSDPLAHFKILSSIKEKHKISFFSFCFVLFFKSK